MQSPSHINNPPQADVGGQDARIAVAIVTIPETASAVFSWTCERALAAALRRNSIPIVLEIPVVHQNFAVAIFVVPRSQRGQAVEFIKQTLTELDLLPFATIALDRSGDSWFTVHGLGTNGVKFENGFLRPEYLEASIATFKKWNSDKLAIYTALLEEHERRAREEGQNPDSQ